MAISFGAIALLCILSAAVLGFSIVFSFFLLMWCGCCRVSDDDSDEGVRRARRDRAEVPLSSTDADPAANPERKGIPLNSRPPRLSPQQQLVRDQALEKYKRRKAREERRCARQLAREAREARLANRREGEGEYDDGEGSGGDDGQSSVTSRTTLTSAATTVRTASTAAYGRGSYLLPPPHLCGVDMDEGDEDDDEGHEVRSAQSRSSRRSSGTAKSKASQGTVATIKSYMRHRQRQRLRRREEQQQVELFNQWAEAQMASSSELSPSSKSSSAGSHEDREATHGRRRSAAAARSGGGGARRQHGDTLASSVNGGYEYLAAKPRQRSSSVASSAPRPPEEILGEDPARYTFLNGAAVDSHITHREQAHLQAGYPATPNTFRVHHDFVAHAYTERREVGGGEEMDEDSAAVPQTYTPASARVHTDPQPLRQQQQVPPPALPAASLPPPQQPRRQRRTWKDVEHSAALSGFFNSPANNSFGGADAHYDDGEAPAPFRGTPAEPSHSPVGGFHPPRE